MPFLAPLFTAIGGAIAGISAWAAASPILAGVVQTAFGIAAKYALSAIFKPQEKARASRLEVEYGSDLARSVGMGYYGTAGHWVYRNAYGRGNRAIQDVFVVSHFRITDVPRIRYQGVWVNIAGLPNDPNDPMLGCKVPGIDGDVWIKIYRGSMTQVADPGLIAYANPAGRWTATDRGIGVSYVIVTQSLNRNKQTSPQQLFFEVKGAPLYDWRLDTTAGGFGPQRWTDQSTWVFSESPVLMQYALERGFFNGTQKMVGKGVSASRLPLAKYTLAANICDELVTPAGGGPQVKKYRAAIIATSGANSTHDANMQPLLESMAGAWVETVDGEYPIAGAEQLVSFTITDDDIMPEEPYRFSAKTPRVELINTVSSTYPSPEKFYAMVPASTRIDATALAEDGGETLASAIPYEAVIYSEQCDRLSDIAIRAARYQGNAEIVISPMYLELAVPGRWIQWNSARNGNMTWQILSVTKGPLNQSTGARNIYLSLREISNGVFDPTAYITDPPGIDPVGDGVYLAEVQNFIASPILVTSTSDEKIPGVRLTWDAINDITVTGVYIEYWPVTDPTQVFKKIAEADITSITLVEGLTSLSDWIVRTRLIVNPERPVAFSGNYPFTTLKAVSSLFPIDVDDLNNDLIANFQSIASNEREVARQLEEVSSRLANMNLDNFSDKMEIRTEIKLSNDNVTAAYTDLIQVYVGPTSALVQQVTTLKTQINDPVTGLNASAANILTLQSGVSSLNGQVTVLATTTNSLTSQINDPTTGLAATASNVATLQTNVTTINGQITSMSTSINTLNSQVNDPVTGLNANATNISALTTTVTSINGVVTAHTTSINGLTAQVNDPSTGLIANSTAISATTVTANTALSQSGTNATNITTLTSNYNSVSATGTFQITTKAAPSGWTASIAMETRINTGATFRRAGLYLDSTATLARVSIVADQFILTDNTNSFPAFSMIGGQLYMTGNVNIQSAIIGNLQVGTSNIAVGATTSFVQFGFPSSVPNDGNRDISRVVTFPDPATTPGVILRVDGTMTGTQHPTRDGGSLSVSVLVNGSTIGAQQIPVARGLRATCNCFGTWTPPSGTTSATITLRANTGNQSESGLCVVTVNKKSN